MTALGQHLWGMSARARERFRREQCGFVFQGYNLFPSLTAREQLEMVLLWSTTLSKSKVHRQIDATLDALDMADKGDLCPSEMSGGEQQRVAIARALIKDPLLCFADEPTSALDWKNNGQVVIKKLKDMARQRKAALLVVSHDNRIIPYADRLFYLDDGRLREASDELSERSRDGG